MIDRDQARLLCASGQAVVGVLHALRTRAGIRTLTQNFSHVFRLAPWLPKACFCGRQRTHHSGLIFVVFNLHIRCRLVHIKDGGHPCSGWTRRLREGADLPRNHDIGCQRLTEDLHDLVQGYARSCKSDVKVLMGPGNVSVVLQVIISSFITHHHAQVFPVATCPTVLPNQVQEEVFRIQLVDFIFSL
jgi:hypothetical protein